MEVNQLVEKAQNGDEAAFEALVRENAQYVFNLALRVVQNPQEAEDIAQEAFIRVWKGLPKFKAEAKFRTWLYRIVTNLCYDRIPRIKKELTALEIDEEISLPDERVRPEKDMVSKELAAEVHIAINNLPESYRLLISLRHLQAMSYAEIAEITGQPLGTVKTGIYRARQMIRQRIEVYERNHR